MTLDAPHTPAQHEYAADAGWPGGYCPLCIVHCDRCNPAPGAVRCERCVLIAGPTER